MSCGDLCCGDFGVGMPFRYGCMWISCPSVRLGLSSAILQLFGPLIQIPAGMVLEFLMMDAWCSLGEWTVSLMIEWFMMVTILGVDSMMELGVGVLFGVRRLRCRAHSAGGEAEDEFDGEEQQQQDDRRLIGAMKQDDGDQYRKYADCSGRRPEMALLFRTQNSLKLGNHVKSQQRSTAKGIQSGVQA